MNENERWLVAPDGQRRRIDMTDLQALVDAGYVEDIGLGVYQVTPAGRLFIEARGGRP